MLALTLIQECLSSQNPRLDLGKCGLTDADIAEGTPIDLALRACTHLQWLTFSHTWWEWKEDEKKWKIKYSQNQEKENFFSHLPSAIVNLSNLQYLYCEGTHRNKWQIQDMSLVSNLTQLIELNLSYNKISEISGLENCTHLQRLQLDGNQIIELKGLDNLSNLQQLSISSNQIIELKGLDNLSILQQLSISSNQIIELKGLENLTNLQHLSISSNQISELKGLGNLTNLQQLEISSNQISELKGLDNLSNLQQLYIYSNQISELKGLENLVNLQKISIFKNQISELKGLGNLTNLQQLYISSNQIGELKGLDNLTNLQQLDVSENQINELKGLDNLTNLQKLEIYKNQINELKGLDNLTNLQKLEIYKNQINELKGLDNLTNLQGLYISENQINELKGLNNLTNLQYLSIYKNQISELKGLDNLTNLPQLDISHNKILDIRYLKTLMQKEENPLKVAWQKYPHNVKQGDINLYGNPFRPSLVEAVMQGNEAVFSWWEEVEKHGLKPLNECKLIFVGDGAVGKTSLMRRLVDNKFDAGEKTTHGINKIAWSKIKNERGEKIRVNLWDFGGQHIQHSLHQIFFTRQVVYVLVLSPRNDGNADYWLELIKKLGCDSEVLVVYNWKDEKDKQAPFLGNFYELQKKYDTLPEPFLLSCKTGEGMKEFKAKLKEIILQQKDLDLEYPTTWYNIKKELEKTTAKEDKIAYEKYAEICDKKGYKEEINQRNLLKQLDKIGSIVFFDKQILDSYQVLNPDWVTTGAYALLTSEVTKNQKGYIRQEDLEEIFKEEIVVLGEANKPRKIKYKKNQFPFIIELMLEFNLCQKNPFCAHTEEYLIPSAFDGQPPKDYSKYKKDCKHYRFVFASAFEMLIMHKFMARNIGKCVEKDYWASGFLIKDAHSDTFALVETSLHENIINFWIKGNNIRDFWVELSRDMKAVFGNYHKFEYKEEVFYVREKEKAFFAYQEMMKYLENDMEVIPYHPASNMKRVNVLEVIGLFKDVSKARKEWQSEKGGDTYNNYYEKVNNIHVGGNDNTILQDFDESEASIG